MTARNGNFCAQQASAFTRTSHRRMPLLKWAIVLLLAGVWLFTGWMGGAGRPPTDAIYQTLGALAMAGGLEDAASNTYRDIARFAGVALTAVGLLFGFSGAVGRALARVWMTGATGHVVVAGQGSAALSLARSCGAAKDAVVLIAPDLAQETAASLRQSGIVLIEGEPTHADMLRAARAGAAAHVVALTGDDAENLRVEAALQVVTPEKRRQPLAAHVAIDAPMLLMEAREMRASGARREGPPVDPRPFSLDEIAARALIARHGVDILDLADRQGRERLHILLFGFDTAAEAIAVRVLMSLWSVRFGEPRVTVLTPKASAADRAFAARYPQARAHDVWKADIAFVDADWTAAGLSDEDFEKLTATRGAPAAAIVSTGSDGANIQLAFALQRSANRRGAWAGPIFMKEATQSEFSRLHAGGDATERLDAYLQAFGSLETTATRAYVIDGLLDVGAAVVHRLYDAAMAAQTDIDMRKLEAMKKGWSAIPETYRNASRASADSALVKLWDLGWRPAPEGVRGDRDPAIDPSQHQRLAEIEHGRWVAERLLNGWRPATVRDNKLMLHTDLVPWVALTDELQGRDRVQVRAAAHAARALCPQGFVRRS
jgi:hypothetical protein